MTKTLNKPKAVTLLEKTYSRENLNVDRENKVIKKVKILGRRSHNNREYSDRSFDDAVRMYEGLEVNIDHPPRKQPDLERSINETFGYIERPYAVKTGPVDEQGVYGDIEYIENTQHTAGILERAERFPTRFGLSHNAYGPMVKSKGKMIVESLQLVRSVDIVGRPATNRGLFESKGDDMANQQTVGGYVKSLRRRDPWKRFLTTFMEEMDVTAEVAEEPMPAAEEGAASGDSESQIKDALKSMIIAAFDDEDLDTKATLKRIRDILNTQDKLLGKASGNGSDDTPKDEEGSGSESESEGGESQESRLLSKLNRKIALMESEKKVRLMLDKAGVEYDEDLVESLAEMTDDGREALIERLKKTQATPESKRRPERSPALLESDSNYKGSDTKEDFFRSVKQPTYMRR